MLISAFEGDQWRQPFLEAYARYAGSAVEKIEYFEVAVCIRRLYTIAVSISAGAEVLECRRHHTKTGWTCRCSLRHAPGKGWHKNSDDRELVVNIIPFNFDCII